MEQETLKKLHETELEILDSIVEICEKHKLQYYLVGGTLLGAVRHRGFIPWDDDLDIAMPRTDYTKFLKIAKVELDKKFFLQTCFTDNNYSRFFSKVRKNNTLFLEKDDECVDRHHGIFVDIFPLDNGKEEYMYKLPLLKRIAYSIDMYIQLTRGRIKHKMGKKIVYKFVPVSLLIIVRDLLFAGKGHCYINYGSQYGLKKQTIDISQYNPPAKLEFEGRNFNVPKEYDQILKRIYGENYMDLPPLEKRITHNPVRLSFDLCGEDEILEG